MPTNNNETAEKGGLAKIDELMADIDLTKPFDNLNNGDRYEIGSCLGKGGFAKVFLGKSLKHESSRAAIKVVPRKRIQKPEQEEKIYTEVAIQSSCNHRNIVKLLSHWSDAEKICLVLEYCPNRTLSHLLKLAPMKRIPEDASVEIIHQVIDALAYLHGHGIVHRDIKLGNILLKRRVAKLADFGLAINYHTTEQKQICGTPNFLAPEVLRHRSHQPKSDLWATGCVLFCLMTGRTPFQYTKMSETAKNILNLNYQMPNYLSAEAIGCIKHILTIDPERRWDHSQIQNSELFVKNQPFKDDSVSFIASIMKVSPHVLPLRPKSHLKDQSISRI